MVKNFLFTALRGPRKLVNSFVPVVQRTQKVSIVEPKHGAKMEKRYRFSNQELSQEDLDFLNKLRFGNGLPALDVELIEEEEDDMCPTLGIKCQTGIIQEMCQSCQKGQNNE